MRSAARLRNQELPSLCFSVSSPYGWRTVRLEKWEDSLLRHPDLSAGTRRRCCLYFHGKLANMIFGNVFLTKNGGKTLQDIRNRSQRDGGLHPKPPLVCRCGKDDSSAADGQSPKTPHDFFFGLLYDGFVKTVLGQGGNL